MMNTTATADRLDANRIKQALTLLHHYEQHEDTRAAEKRASATMGLTKAERSVLRRTVHLV